MELHAASHQWFSRPADERFPDLKALHAACERSRSESAEKIVPWAALRAQALDDGAVALVGQNGNPALLTNWAFGQIAQRASAPAGFLRTLPAPLAAECVNVGLARRADDDGARQAHLLFNRNGNLVVRAAVSERYARIWNADITSRLLRLSDEQGWKPATPTIRAKAEGDTALFASDRDLFAFLDHPDRIVKDGSEGGLRRGFFVSNSEVGAAAFKVSGFYFRDICGNFIVWGATDLRTVSIRHIGQAPDKAWADLTLTVRRYLDSEAGPVEDKIRTAQRTLIGSTKDEVLDKLFSLKPLGLSREILTAGFEAVVPDEDGDPKSAWGIAQGLTRYSQTRPYTDERNDIDRAAGKLLEVVF
jgi:hypothetical protein